MLCPRCHRQVSPTHPYCPVCGAQLRDDAAPLELLLVDGTRIALVESVTVGRAPDNAVWLDDPSVSRAHARIVVGGRVPLVEDVGSTHGTWIDDERVVGPTELRDGARLRFGDTELLVESARPVYAAGHTLHVRAGESLVIRRAAQRRSAPAARDDRLRPRVRSGWSLKRLDVAEGERRFVLRDGRGDGFLRMDASDAGLFELLDGTRSVDELVRAARDTVGEEGPRRIARLLSELGDRGFLDGVEPRPRPPMAAGRLRRWLRPREHTVAGAGARIERIYEHGGYLLFTRPALAALAALGGAGMVTFAALIALRYGTPLVVADRLGIGGLVFLGGRLLLVSGHELAHGLAVTSFGRRVQRAGVKLLLVFPYLFVDTSEMWFEPRRRRMAVGAAGPACDLVLGGAFVIACAVASPGTVRDVLFQLAFAGYVGAVVNLNPMLDRDGYHLLADLTREPALRRRSREELCNRLRGRVADGGARSVLMRYAVASLGWSLATAAIVAVVSLRYYDRLVAVAPKEAVWAVLIVLYAALLLPLAVALAGPLLRRRHDDPELIRVA